MSIKIKSMDCTFLTGGANLFNDKTDRRFAVIDGEIIPPYFGSKLLDELLMAHTIIQNAQNVMLPHQVQAWASLNSRDGIVGLHINRMHERRLLIAEAKEHYERSRKKARLWRCLFRHTA